MAIMARWRRKRREGPVAFVLSGGGNLGALQIGMLRALVERGIRPDLVLGCSVGAINGAGLAEDPTIAGVGRMERLWQELDGKQLMPRSILPQPVAMARRGEAISDNAGLRRAVEESLAARTFEDLAVPFQCVATDTLGVREVWFTSGSLIEPILASAALPAVYPSVEIDGVRYLDGAIVDDVPVGRAVELGARTVYVLQVSGFARPRPEPRRPIDVAIQSYWIARHHRFKRELEAVPDGVDVHLLPTGQTPAMRFDDFTRSGELMALAYAASSAYLAGRPARPALPEGPADPSAVLGAAADGAEDGEGDREADGGRGRSDRPPVAGGRRAPSATMGRDD
jgi:NTE family protein